MHTNIDYKLNKYHIQVASDVLKLISDPTRLQILWALLHGEHSVNELAEDIGAKQAAVSQHLGKLRLGNMVKVRRDGNRMFYSADNEHVRALVTQALSQAEHVVEGHSKE